MTMQIISMQEDACMIFLSMDEDLKRIYANQRRGS
jgi:hypothetical protein